MMLWHTEKSWSASNLWSHLCSDLFHSSIWWYRRQWRNTYSMLCWCNTSFSCTCSLSHWRILHHCCTFSCSFLHSPRNLRHIPAAEPAPPASSPSSPSPSSNVTWKRIRSWPTKQSTVSRLQTVHYIAQNRGDKRKCK